VDWTGEEEPKSLPYAEDELELISTDVSRRINVDSLRVESTRWLSAVVIAQRASLLTLCNSTPRLMLASVMKAMMMRDPTR
jgi:hypothetical protein